MPESRSSTESEDIAATGDQKEVEMPAPSPEINNGIGKVLEELRAITAEELRSALDPMPQEGDAFAGIVIARLDHAAIPAEDKQEYVLFGARVYPGKHVNPHYHQYGEEPYEIRAGAEAIMHLGNITESTVTWQPAETKGVGDEIIVKEGEVHSLENTGTVPLDFAFACPEAHLTEEDRVFTHTGEFDNGTPEYLSAD